MTIYNSDEIWIILYFFTKWPRCSLRNLGRFEEHLKHSTRFQEEENNSKNKHKEPLPLQKKDQKNPQKIKQGKKNKRQEQNTPYV